LFSFLLSLFLRGGGAHSDRMLWPSICMTALAEGAVKFIEVGGVGDGTMRARLSLSVAEAQAVRPKLCFASCGHLR
jgi:hypothetical protein